MRLHLHYIPRSVAKQHGLKHYFTGKPCIRGMVDVRRTADKKCRCGACRKEKSAQGKRHHAENRQRGLELMRKYAEENANSIRERRRKNYVMNRERNLNMAAAKRKVRSSEIAEYLSFWRKENPEVMRRWRQENSDKVRFYATQRHAAKISRTPSWFSELDEFVVLEASALQDDRKRLHGFEWQVDHMIPMRAEKASGLHVGANLQVIPAHVNRFKRNRLIMTEPMEWMRYAS